MFIDDDRVGSEVSVQGGARVRLPWSAPGWFEQCRHVERLECDAVGREPGYPLDRMWTEGDAGFGAP